MEKAVLPAHRKKDLVHEHLREQVLSGIYEPVRRLTLPELSRDMAGEEIDIRDPAVLERLVR